MSLRFPLALALLGAATAAHAGTPRTFDVTQLTPPDGFAIDDKSADHLSMTDTAPGRFGVIAVYAGRPASGDLAADFKTQWQDAVAHMMQPDATPEPVRGTMPGGAGLEVGSSTAKMEGKDVYARLFVIDGGAKVVAVLVVTPNADLYDRYEDAVNAMLAGMTVTKTAVPTTPPPAPKPPTPAPVKGAKAPPPPPPPPPAYKLVPLPDDPALPAAPTVDKKVLANDWQHLTATPPDKASAVYGDLYSITPKGKFEYRFIGKAGTGDDVLRENDAGGYAYKDGRLLLLFNRRGQVTYRITGYDKSAGTLTLLPDGLPQTAGNATIFGQTWTLPKAHGKGHGKH